MQLEFGGKYTAGNAFKQCGEDVKKLQRQCKDFADAGRSMLGELSGAFSGKLNGAISPTVDILQASVKGGIWGLVGGIVSVCHFSGGQCQTLTLAMAPLARLETARRMFCTRFSRVFAHVAVIVKVRAGTCFDTSPGAACDTIISYL